MRRVYVKDAAERAADRERLQAIAAEVLAEVPGSAIAADQAGRDCDLAIDFAEDVGPLDDEAVRAIVGVFERRGAVAKVSSIHVNGWFGAYDKLSMCERLLVEELGTSREAMGPGRPSSAIRPMTRPCSGVFLAPSGSPI